MRFQDNKNRKVALADTVEVSANLMFEDGMMTVLKPVARRGSEGTTVSCMQGRLRCHVADSHIDYVMTDADGTDHPFTLSDLAYHLTIGQERHSTAYVEATLTDSLAQALSDGRYDKVGDVMALAADNLSEHLSPHTFCGVTVGMAVVRLCDGSTTMASNLFALYPAATTGTVSVDYANLLLRREMDCHQHSISVDYRGPLPPSVIDALVRSVDIYLSAPLLPGTTRVEKAPQYDGEGRVVSLDFAAIDKSEMEQALETLTLRRVLRITPGAFGVEHMLRRVHGRSVRLHLNTFGTGSVGGTCAYYDGERLTLGDVTECIGSPFTIGVTYVGATPPPDVSAAPVPLEMDMLAEVEVADGGTTVTHVFRSVVSYPLAMPLMVSDPRVSRLTLHARITYGMSTHHYRLVRSLSPCDVLPMAYALHTPTVTPHGGVRDVIWSLSAQWPDDGTWEDEDAASWLAVAARVSDGELPAHAGDVWASGGTVPLTFPPGERLHLGEARVVAVSVATRRFSGVQFGIYPYYVVTEGGIHALQHQNGEGWKSHYLLAQEEPLCRTLPVSTRSGMVVATTRGLLLVEGSRITCLTGETGAWPSRPFLPLCRLPHLHEAARQSDGTERLLTLMTSTVPLPELLATGAVLHYDYSREHLYVLPPAGGAGMGYVCALRSGWWSLVSVEDAAGQEPRATFLLSRALPLEGTSYSKRIGRVVVQGAFPGNGSRESVVRTLLYGSNDSRQWLCVASGRSHVIDTVSGTPFRYYRLAALTGC